ncbi:MAG: hypothetical protein ACE5G7_00795 [Candidatus Hydrothermarchaeaceae archaeon]
MVDVLTLALIGIYLLLLTNLVFNFVLAIRLHGVKSDVVEAEERSIEEAELMEARLNKIKEEILHSQGHVQ